MSANGRQDLIRRLKVNLDNIPIVLVSMWAAILVVGIFVRKAVRLQKFRLVVTL